MSESYIEAVEKQNELLMKLIEGSCYPMETPFYSVHGICEYSSDDGGSFCIMNKCFGVFSNKQDSHMVIIMGFRHMGMQYYLKTKSHHIEERFLDLEYPEYENRKSYPCDTTMMFAYDWRTPKNEFGMFLHVSISCVKCLPNRFLQMPWIEAVGKYEPSNINFDSVSLSMTEPPI